MVDPLELVQVALLLFVHLLLVWWVLDAIVRGLFRKVDTKVGSAALPREPEPAATGPPLGSGGKQRARRDPTRP